MVNQTEMNLYWHFESLKPGVSLIGASRGYGLYVSVEESTENKPIASMSLERASFVISLEL